VRLSEEVEDAIMIMSRKIYVLHEIEGREERERLISERIGVVIKVDIEVAGNDELMWCSSSHRQEGSRGRQRKTWRKLKTVGDDR